MPRLSPTALFRICAVCAAWVLSVGTGALAEPEPERNPGWFPAGDEARFPRSAFVVGVGACGAESAPEARRTCAVTRAREELVLSIRAQLTATRSREASLTVAGDGRGATAASKQQTVSSGTAKGTLELENIAPQDAACTGQACFALVALSRSDYAARVRRRHDALRAQLDPLIAREEASKEILVALRALTKAEELAESMDALADAIALVAGPDQAPPAARLAVAERRRAWLGRVHVCLEATGADANAPVLLSQAAAALGGLGFAESEIARAGGCGKAAMAVLLRADFQPAREAGALQALDLHGELSIVIEGRVVGAATPIVAHALAPDLGRARAEAQAQFAARAKETLLRALSGDSS